MNELPKTSQNLIDQLRGMFFAKDRPVILPKEGFIGFHSIDTPDSLPPYPYRYMYVKADGSLYLFDYEGNEYLIWSNIGTGYAPNDASYVTINAETALPNERVLTQGTGITVTDGGNIVTVSTNDGQIDHDALLNFAVIEHINHSLVDMEAGDGLSGGGDISASRTFAVNVDDATIEINADTLRVKIDGINDTHIDWGTAVNQVSAVDMPIADAGGYFTTDNVEAALQQIGNAGGAGGFTQYYIPFGGVTGGLTESSELQYTPGSGLALATEDLLFGTDWTLDHNGINLSLTSNISDGNFEINVNDGGVNKRVFLINASDNAKVFFGEDDLYRGFLTLYGDTTGVAFGGLIDFFTSADYDTNTEYYRLGTYQEKFTLRNDANDILTEVTHTGQLQVPTVGSSAGVLIGDELIWQPSTGLLRTNASVGINTNALYALDVNGDSYFNDDMIITGNLAVGAAASSPVRPLHVENTAPVVRISDSNALTDTDVIAYQEWYRGHNDNRIGFFGFSSASNENIVLVNSTANGDIEFRTNSTESMRILDSGRVGIGVSLAKSILDISDTTPILTLTDETIGTWDYGDSFIHISSYTNDTSGVWPGENAYIRSAHLRSGAGHTNPDAGWVFGMSESTLLPEDSIFFSTLSDRVMVEIGYQDVTKRGWLYLYGAATGNSIGAVIEMAPAADYDGTISSWRTEIYQDDYRIITSDSVTSLLYTYQGQLQLPTTGLAGGLLIGGDVQLYRSAANQLTIPDSVVISNSSTLSVTTGANIYVGVDDNTRGILSLYGDITGSTSGGELRIYNDADDDTLFEYWRIWSFAQDLYIEDSLGNYPIIIKWPGDVTVYNNFTAGGIVRGSGGLQTIQSTANFSNPPTDAELDAEFGTPSGRGFIATIDDNDADTTSWLVWRSDASWYYVQGTKAV